MKRKSVFYHLKSDDPAYTSIYGRMGITLGSGAINNRTKAKAYAKFLAEKEGWKNYWIEETLRIDTIRKFGTIK